MEYDGLKQKGLRIVIDIEPTSLFPTEPYTVEQANRLPGKILELLRGELPDGQLAVATVKAKL